MSNFFKSQAVRNLGNIPGSLSEQDLCFLVDAAGNDLGRRFPSSIFEYFIQVVDMYLERIGKIAGCPELQHLGCILNWELPFKQLYEQAEYARRGVDASIHCLERFEFLAIVNEFQKIGTKQIILERIIGFDFRVHFIENLINIIKLIK